MIAYIHVGKTTNLAQSLLLYTITCFCRKTASHFIDIILNSRRLQLFIVSANSVNFCKIAENRIAQNPFLSPFLAAAKRFSLKNLPYADTKDLPVSPGSAEKSSSLFPPFRVKNPLEQKLDSAPTDMKIDLIFRHEDFLPKHGIGRTAIVIDVLRATTSIVTAVTNGVDSVVPVMTPDEAFEMREQRGHLLAGEQNGLMIEGFDFGNSPLEFQKSRVEGRTLVLCTSNGTKAIVKASIAENVLIASFLNAAAIVRHAKKLGRDIVILCSGTIGQRTLEDTVCGGMIAAALDGELTPDALEAVEIYLKYKNGISRCLEDSHHGKDLVKLGFADDLDYAAQVDITGTVPILQHPEKRTEGEKESASPEGSLQIVGSPFEPGGT